MLGYNYVEESIENNMNLFDCPKHPTTTVTLKQANKHQGPVVQSVVSLTSSLRVISLTVLADSIHNILIFFAEKM